MRLPHRNMIPALGLLAALSCSAGGSGAPPREGYIYPVQGESSPGKKTSETPTSYPWMSTRPPPDLSAENKDGGRSYFLARVDKEGTILLGDAVVTERQFLEEAKEALESDDGVVAVLLVESGITQGIHLSAELSGIGFKNVQIYYPTATTDTRNTE